MICGVGFWEIDGYIRSSSRSAVAPDSSDYWRTDFHKLSEHGGNIHGLYWGTSGFAGTFAVETIGKENPVESESYFRTGITVNAGAGSYAKIETHVKIIKDGQVYSESLYTYVDAYEGENGGTIIQTINADVGSDLLGLAAAGLSITQPELAAVAAAASIISKYGYIQG